MHTESIAYEAAGKSLTGFLAKPLKLSGHTPGILVCHQGMGLNNHTRTQTRKLAELGYVALALDMYGELGTSREHVTAMMAALADNPDQKRARLNAGIDLLKSQSGVDPSRLAAIGHCYGGGLVLELARLRQDIAAVVAFHPGLMDQVEVDDRPVNAKVLICAGYHDPLIPASARERLIKLMSDQSADWQLITYGKAGHSFSDESVAAFGMDGFEYDQDTDARSWAAMRAMLDECFPQA